MSTGEYVTGWAKRGPTEVIGTNKSDAAETVRSLVEDASNLPEAPRSGDILAVLDSRRVNYTDWAGWLRLDAHEIALGRARSRERTKVADLATMLEVLRREQSSM